MDKAKLIELGVAGCPVESQDKLCAENSDCVRCQIVAQRDSDHDYYQAEIDRLILALTHEVGFREKAEAELAEVRAALEAKSDCDKGEK